jgi:predicted RNase H-like HicB family nuclease
MSRMAYVAVIEKTPNGFSAYVPDLPGCVAAAKTRRGVRKLIAEAVEMHIAGLREDGVKIPRPTTRAVELQTA